MLTIAGHTFVEGMEGRVCSVCGRRFVAIAGATRDDLNKPDIAHSGFLIERELEEIQSEVARIWTELCDVARGGE